MNTNSNSSIIGTSLVAFIGGMVAWAVFGPKIKSKMASSSKWREISNEINREALKVSELTQTKYDQIVDEVTSKYAKLKDISENELSDMSKDLKTHWSKIKDKWNSDPVRPADKDNGFLNTPTGF